MQCNVEILLIFYTIINILNKGNYLFRLFQLNIEPVYLCDDEPGL